MNPPQHPIFQRMQLSAAALRTVAERRYGDAVALLRTKSNERANGAMYMAGFVIECLLKAHMVEEYSWLTNGARPTNGTDEQKEIWSLCYRSHDLDELLGYLPGLRDRLGARTLHSGKGPLLLLQQVSATWTIYARYSSRLATHQEATKFVEMIKELKLCLQQKT